MNMNEKNEISNLERYKLDQKNIKRKVLDIWNGKKVYGIDKSNPHIENMKNHQDLVFAILHSAIEEGDYKFFDTESANAMVKFLKPRTDLPINTMREKAKENHDISENELIKDSIFGIVK